MRTVIVLATAAIVLPSAGEAIAQQATPPAPATTALPQANQAKSATHERVVCETDQVLGSLVPRRICMTQSQWDSAREGARRAIRDQAQDVRPHTQTGGN